MTVISTIAQIRFDALAGYTRHPQILNLVQEFAWRSSPNDRVLGVATWDRLDYDFGWVALARDERLRYRAIDMNASLASAEGAIAELEERMRHHTLRPDVDFHQGDAEGPPVDFFTPVVPEARLHPNFRLLATEAHYSPAREIISAMMRYHEDLDGNFVEQFQTVAFDARLWELYLFATFTELGYTRADDAAAPDFNLLSNDGPLCIEATTANPSAVGAAPAPTGTAEFVNYLENYIPIKLGRALRRKLNKQPPYWSLEPVQGKPLIFAVQDFHGPRTMQLIVPAATEYVFGVRHSRSGGVLHVEYIQEHRYGATVERSGFFSMPGSENISAVLVNPLGTLTKFNRMGLIAGFGDQRIRMVRRGMQRNDTDVINPAPKHFTQTVGAPGYTETWIEGASVLHNPHALHPLHPAQVPGAAHEFLQSGGRIMSLLPEFQPVLSETRVIAPLE